MRFENTLNTMFTDNSFIRFDWAAKYMLRDKADFEIFEGFLTVLFKEKVKIVELLESESNKEKEDAKYNRVDIKAKNSKDEIILVEIQLDHDAYYLERILFGVSKTITEHIGEGQAYNTVKKVYSINILYFNLGTGNDYLYYGTNEFVGVHTGDTLLFNHKGKKQTGKTKRSNIFPEYYIIRVGKFKKEKPRTHMEEWVLYLKNGFIKPDTKAPGLKKARERLRVLSMDDKTRKAYENYLLNKNIEKNVIETAIMDGEELGLKRGMKKGMEQGKEIGMAEGRAEGRAEGEAKATLSIVQRMKAAGMDPATIAQLTGYSE